MPTIKVDTSLLGDYELDLQGILGRVDSIVEQFDSVSRNLDWDIKAESGIDSILLGISRELSDYSRGLDEMKKYLGNARRQYDSVENTNSEKELKNEVSGYKINWMKGLFQVVGKIGNVGSIVKSIYTLGNAISNKEKATVCKSIINVSKDCVTRFGTLAENAYKDNSNVRETLFGDWTKGGAVTKLFTTAEEATTATRGTIFKAALLKEIDNYGFKTAPTTSTIRTVGSKIKVGTKWSWAGLSAVTNFVSNKEEQNKNPEMSNARVVSETVVETAIDIGVGALATAGATALIGASAPAVAVGAVAVGAVWAVNTGVEAVTAHLWGEDNKKNLTELASDAIIDSAIYIGNKAGSTTKSSINVVTKWGKTFWEDRI